MTTISESFRVADADHAWAYLTDLNQLIPCVPGAIVRSSDGPGSVIGEMTVKMGSMGMVFGGPVRIESEDPISRAVVIRADTTEEGGSRAHGTISISMSGDECTLVSDAEVSGKAASMGQGTVAAVLTQLARQFASNLSSASAAIGDAADPPPPGVGVPEEGAGPEPGHTGSDDEDAAPTASDDPPPQAPPLAVPFDMLASAVGDLPASKDILGFAPLVRALHALLDDPETGLPLAIAITAPWGSGKSSVMRQLQGLLEASSAGANRDASRRVWKTVRFDAWKYERSERIWAALVKAIYDQAQDRMSLRQKVLFRARLERRRLGLLKLAAVVITPLLVAAAGVTAALVADLSQRGTALAGLSSAALVLGAASRYGAIVVNPFRRAIEVYARRPNFEGELGFTSEADAEVRMLVSLLAPDRHEGLAVFVDDLDRCNCAHIVEIVEAMNQIFNAAEDHNCLFVLGLDRDIVATNISAAYAETVSRLREDGNPLGEQFGSAFLAKLVQLSVAIPRPDDDAMIRLMEAVTGTTRPPAAGDVDVSTGIVSTVPGIGGWSIGNSMTPVAGRVHDDPEGRARAVDRVRRERAQRIKDSPDVVAAEFAALGFLEPNPRLVKRFHNAFRLQLYVASEDDRVTFDFSFDQLLALARWVALRLRWPSLADAITREPQLLLALESAANVEPDALSRDVADDLRKRHGRWLANAAVLAIIRDAEPRRRLTALRLDAFARVA